MLPWNLHLKSIVLWHPHFFRLPLFELLGLVLLSSTSGTVKAQTVCVAIVNNASWHTAAAWSCGVVPSLAAGDVAEIPANFTMVISQSPVVNYGHIKVSGELQVSGPQGGLQNNGVIDIEVTGLLDNYNRQVNIGPGATIQNNGQILNRSNSYFVSGGTLQNAGTFNNQVNAQLANIAGLISNHGQIINDGNIDNSNAGVIQNHATGNIQNQGVARLTNPSGSQIQNLGMIMNVTGALIDNDGAIYNQATINNGVGARIENGPGSVIETSGLLKNYNAGTIVNEGHLLQQGPGQLTSEGDNSRITNRGVITNRGMGYTINKAGSVLFNGQNGQILIDTSGPTLRNETGAVLRNQGSLTNNHNLFNQGETYNCNGATINNTYKFGNDNKVFNYGVINGSVSGNQPVSPPGKAC